jgi:hypothetical protein
MAKTLTVTGGDLYHLALQELGDATQWNRIAQANASNGGPPMDPFLSGLVVLKVPSVNPAITGGILVV